MKNKNQSKKRVLFSLSGSATITLNVTGILLFVLSGMGIIASIVLASSYISSAVLSFAAGAVCMGISFLSRVAAEIRGVIREEYDLQEYKIENIGNERVVNVRPIPAGVRAVTFKDCINADTSLQIGEQFAKEGKITLQQYHWEYLLEHPRDGVIEKLLPEYIPVVSKYHSEDDIMLSRYFTEYVQSLPFDVAANALYSSSLSKAVDLIVDLKLLSPAHVLAILKGGDITSAIAYMRARKDYYTRDDLFAMKEIVDHIQGLRKPEDAEKKRKRVIVNSLNIDGISENEAQIIIEFCRLVRAVEVAFRDTCVDK